MIGQNEEVVMVEALPPEHGKSASVNWKPVTSELSPGNQEATNGQVTTALWHFLIMLAGEVEITKHITFEKLKNIIIGKPVSIFWGFN